MSENKSKYDLLLENSASRETFLFSGLTDTSENHLYYKFEGLEMDIPEGEYTYCLLRNDRNDVVYDYKTPLGDTLVHADGQEVLLKDLQPATGLLRVGDKVETTNIYNNDKQTIFYYEG